jgi:Outer membrane protein beta-barrel family/Carboxypeptidase regulatory-like domain
MNRLFTFLPLLVIAAQAVAQTTVSGLVQEKTGTPPGTPAGFATVALQNASDSSIAKGAMTDDKGAFRLLSIAPGRYFVSVQSVGFQKTYSPVFAVATQPVTVDILTLMPETRALQEVTVKAQKSLIEQQADRAVLNVEGSVITKGSKVNDLLRYAPRVRVSGDGGISVGNKSNVLILVDGRQMGAAALASFLQNFSAEDVLKIEVITNPSVKYDASFGAVINIVTKKTLEQGLNGRIALIYSQGQGGQFSPDASLNFRRGKWNSFATVSANRSTYRSVQNLTRFFPDEAINNNFAGFTPYQSVAVNAGLDYEVDKNHVIGARLNSQWHSDNTVLTANTTFMGVAGRIDSLLRTVNDGRNKTQLYEANLNYKGTLDTNGRELTLNLTQTWFTKNAVQLIDYQSARPGGELMGKPTFIQILNPNRQYNLIGQADYATPIMHKKAKLDLGAKFIFIQNDNQLTQQNLVGGQYITDPAFSNTGLYRENTYAAYANLSRSLKNGYAIQGGLRYERTEQELTNSALKRTYAGLFPSLGLNRSLPDGRSWGITFSRKITRPDLGSLVPFRFLADRFTYVQGNPLIKPQFSNTIDGYYTLKNGITWFANYTHNRDQITQLLRADPVTRVYTQNNDNLHSVSEAYAGVTVPKNLTKSWQTNTMLAVLGNHTNSPVNELTNFQATGGWASLSSTNIFSLPHDWKYELTLSYQSPLRSSLYTQKSFYWASMSLTKPVLHKNGTVRIAIDDVFRTQFNRSSASYGMVDVTVRSYYDPQRIKLTFSYNFGKKTVKQARQNSLGNEAERGRMGR